MQRKKNQSYKRTDVYYLWLIKILIFRLDKKALAHFFTILGVVICKNYVARPLHSFNKCRKSLLSSLETFFCRNLKNVRMSFWVNVMLRQSRLRASRASPAQKWQGLRVVCSKNFSRATFFVFWSTQMVDIYLSYLSVKQIWWKSAVCVCVLKWPVFSLQIGETTFGSI